MRGKATKHVRTNRNSRKFTQREKNICDLRDFSSLHASDVVNRCKRDRRRFPAVDLSQFSHDSNHFSTMFHHFIDLPHPENSFQSMTIRKLMDLDRNNE